MSQFSPGVKTKFSHGQQVATTKSLTDRTMRPYDYITAISHKQHETIYRIGGEWFSESQIFSRRDVTACAKGCSVSPKTHLISSC